MTMHQEHNKVALEGNLLTSQEQVACKQIANLEAPHSQRALALLALNENNTQAQAAEQAGLTVGQVKYWIAKFRKQRLGIFPDTLLNKLEVEDAELVTGIEEEPELASKDEETAEEKKKSTGAKEGKAKMKRKTGKKTQKAEEEKKGKKTKKSRKAKKEKKGKKTKKSRKAKKGKKGKETTKPRKAKKERKSKKGKEG